jgi:hypothetical protein
MSETFDRLMYYPRYFDPDEAERRYGFIGNTTAEFPEEGVAELAKLAWEKIIPIGKSDSVSIVRGEPPDLSSILVSRSTEEPSRQGSGSPFRSSGGAPLPD